MQGKNNGERKNRVKKIEDSNCSLLSQFWSTSRSPFSTFYIPFQSSGSQESNYSNGVRFGVEMKELQPLEANHSKLKEEFYTAAKSPFCYEYFAAILHSAVEFPQKFPDSCDTLEAEHRKLKSNFAALWNQPFVAKWFRSPFCASTKSRRPHFHMRIGP